MKKSIIHILLLVAGALSIAYSSKISAKQSLGTNLVKKPNFLWLVSEDNSKHFANIFDKNGASMPNIESLADNGLIFENAFSNAPVCSTARSTLATGVYAPKFGTQYHRASQKVNLPSKFKVLSQLMQDAGYYTSNNLKTDYNFSSDNNIWDESSGKASWQNRQKGQAFFHMQTWYDTHEFNLHFPVSDIRNRKMEFPLNKVNLFPIYPDTSNFKYTHAKYLEQHKVIDKKIGQVINKLKNDGLLEDTFVFYFGDHGGVMPASKGHIYERGLAIPLIIRIPENFKHLVGKEMQSPNKTRIKGFVSFVDFAPTILNLAGIEKYALHDGTAFLGPDISLHALNNRNTTFSYADRFDEKLNFARAIRVGQYKYIRSFMPYYPDALFNAYRYKQTAMHEWRSLFRTGQLNSVQSAFFESHSAERLYDIDSDPHETINLADKSEYKSTLLSLRKQLNQQLKSMPDLSFYPESMLVKQAFLTPYDLSEQAQEISELIDIANMQYADFDKVSVRLRTILQGKSVLKKYWALIVLTSFASEARAFIEPVQKLYDSEAHPLIRGRAIEFLSSFKLIDTKLVVNLLAQSKNDLEKLELLNIATYLHDVHGYIFELHNDALQPLGSMDEKLINGWFQDRKKHLASAEFLIPYSDTY